MGWKNRGAVPPPEPKTKRPKTIAEAKLVIEKAMAENDWDPVEQKQYQQMIGVNGFNKAEDVRKTIDDLSKSHMVLFED